MLTDFRLQLFVTVAECLSFTKASERLHISQPAVTKHIKELEFRVGGALFIRQGHRIQLTEKGEQLIHYAKSILNEYGKLNDLLQEEQNLYEGVLRIGASTTIAQYLLPRLLAQFKQRYPHIEVQLLSGNSEEVGQMLMDHEVEIGLVEDDFVHPSLSYEEYQEDRIVLVTRSGNPLIRKKEISLRELCTLPLVIRESGSGTLAVINHALEEQGITRKSLTIEMQLGSSEGIIHYLQHSNSIAFISQIAVDGCLQEERLKEIFVEGLSIKRHFRFVAMHGDNSRLGELFKNYCL